MILPLEGEHAGVEHWLQLNRTDFRERLGALVLQYPPVGPCILTRQWLMPGVVAWEFATPDGATVIPPVPIEPEQSELAAAELLTVTPV